MRVLFVLHSHQNMVSSVFLIVAILTAMCGIMLWFSLTCLCCLMLLLSFSCGYLPFIYFWESGLSDILHSFNWVVCIFVLSFKSSFFILGPLHFHMNFIIILSIFTEKIPAGILTGVLLNLLM